MLLKFRTEAEWLEARKQDVTSTEVAALFGLHPYKSRLQLWYEKKGLVQPEFIETNFTKWGRRLQTAVGLGICEDEGWEGFDLTGFYARAPECRLGASFDIRAIKPKKQKKKRGILEVKVAESFTEEHGWHNESAPMQYEFQLQTQLHLDVKSGDGDGWGAIGALGRRQATRLYQREYDAKTGGLIEEECFSFWKSIDDDKPPAPDYAVDSELLESIRKPLRIGDVVILTGNNRAQDLAESYAEKRARLAEIQAQAKPLEDDLKAIKSELWHMMGRNERAVIGPYQIGARVQTREESFSYGSSFRRFDFKKQKGN